ncbi:PIR protein, partial [Plasmodium vivax]
MALLPENNWEYIKLDNEDIKGYSDNYCEKDLGSTNAEDKALCNKVSKHLKRLSGISNNDDRKHGCFYFQHWFLDQIRKKYSADNKINNKPVSEKLFDLVATNIAKYSNMESCRCYNSGTPEEWKGEKDLHDYFKNYEDINCTNSNKSTCEKYVSYVTYIDKLFQNKEFICCDYEDVEPVCERYIKCEGNGKAGQGAAETGSIGNKGAETGDTGNRVAGPGDKGSKETRPGDLGSKAPGTADAGGKAPGTADAGGKAPGTTDLVSKAEGPGDPGSKAAGPEVQGSKEAGPEVLGSQVAGNKAEGSAGTGSEQKGPEGTEGDVAKPAPVKPAPAKPVAAKPVTTVLGGTESGEGTPEALKPAAETPVPAKPVAAKPA